MTAINLEQLCDSINEIMPNLCITIDDLRRPTTEVMMRYFVNVLAEHGLKNASELALQQMHNPELFKDIIMYHYVYQALRKIYPSGEHLRNFNLNTLMDPKPDDIRYIYCVQNYFIFYHEKISGFLGPCVDLINKLDDEYEALKKKEQDMLNFLNLRAMGHAKAKVDDEAIENHTAVASSLLVELKKKKLELADEVKAVTLSMPELKEELEHKRREVQEVNPCSDLLLQKEHFGKQLKVAQMSSEQQVQALEVLEKKKSDKLQQHKLFEEALSSEEKNREDIAQLKKYFEKEQNYLSKLKKIEEENVKVNPEKCKEHISECLQKKNEIIQEKNTFQTDLKKTVSKKKKNIEATVKAMEEVVEAYNKIASSKIDVKLQEEAKIISEKKEDRKNLDSWCIEQRDRINNQAGEFHKKFDESLQKFKMKKLKRM